MIDSFIVLRSPQNAELFSLNLHANFSEIKGIVKLVYCSEDPFFFFVISFGNIVIVVSMKKQIIVRFTACMQAIHVLSLCGLRVYGGTKAILYSSKINSLHKKIPSFGLAMSILARLLPKYEPRARPNSPDVPSKRTKKVRLGINMLLSSIVGIKQIPLWVGVGLEIF